jgi:hypothetical protein
MILVDTSVWIDHFRTRSATLAGLLGRQEVMTHAAIIGELACGKLHRRAQTLGDLQRLPRARDAEFRECLVFLDRRELAGQGLGWNDVQILAAAVLENVLLWSKDRRLRAAAEKLGRAFSPS